MKIKKLSGTAIVMISLLIFLGIMLFSALELKPQFDHSKLIVEEGQLSKNTRLKIGSGERYAYTYNFRNTSFNMTYAIVDGGVCTFIQLLESNDYTCIDEFGNDKEGLNSSYSMPSIVLLKPWMLAVEENWRWDVTSYLVFGDLKKKGKTLDYEFMRKEIYKGREAYVIRMSDSEGDEVWYWVDAEKRIMLRELGPNYEMELISGLSMQN